MGLDHVSRFCLILRCAEILFLMKVAVTSERARCFLPSTPLAGMRPVTLAANDTR